LLSVYQMISPSPCSACVHFGAGKSGGRFSSGSSQNLVNRYCSLLVCRSAAGTISSRQQSWRLQQVSWHQPFYQKHSHDAARPPLLLGAIKHSLKKTRFCCLDFSWWMPIIQCCSGYFHICITKPMTTAIHSKTFKTSKSQTSVKDKRFCQTHLM